jgi:hypothetical protein
MDAHGGEAVDARLVAVGRDVVRGGVGAKERMVDHPGDVASAEGHDADGTLIHRRWHALHHAAAWEVWQCRL